MNQPTNITNITSFREEKEAKKPFPMSLEEAKGYIETEPSVDFTRIQALYELVAVHVREDFLAYVAKSKDITPLRKSMLFQVAHYIENGPQVYNLSLYMALAIYYGLQQEKTTLEISRLGDIFIRNGIPANAVLESFVVEGLTSAPWKFSGNERTKIITSLRTFYRTMPNA